MALPNLTDAQRKEALKKATEARHKRALLREDIKSGKLSLKQVLAKKGDPTVDRMKVATLLESLPGFGKAKAAKVLEELGISSSRRIQGLGKVQEAALIERFSK